MNAKQAYKILVDKIPNRKIVSCHEYNSVFVFNTWPASYDGRNMLDEPPNGLFSVNKSNGMVMVFSPLSISIAEYENGKEVKDFKTERISDLESPDA